MATGHVKILVTCFEPFGGSRVNASKEAVNAMHLSDRSIEVVRLELPVVFGECIDRAVETIDEFLPDAVLSVGEAAGRSGVSVERVAVNLMDARIRDNKGAKPVDRKIRQDGPDAYFATVPVREIVKRILGAGIPADVSMSAGTFVCNDLFYGLADLAHTGRCSMQVGFLHLPCTPEEAVTEYGTLPSMGKTVAATAVERAVLAVADGIRRQAMRKKA